MARIRSVKPEYWEDEKIAQLSRDARLLFIGLWNHADDEGRMRANPKYVKSKVFPYDDDLDVHALLCEIACLQLICLYKAGGQEYLWIRNFKKHQKIDRPQPSQLPAPPDSCVDEGVSTTAPSALPPFDDNSTNSPRTIDGGVGVEWIGSGEGMEGEGESARTRRPTLADCKKWSERFGGSDVQAEKLFWHYESKGWPSNGLGIRIDAIVKKWLLGDAERALTDTRGSPGGKSKRGKTIQEMQSEIGDDLVTQGIFPNGE